MAELMLQQRSAFARRIAELPASGGDIRVADSSGATLVAIRSLDTNGAEQAMAELLGTMAVEGPSTVAATGLLLIGIGLGSWLVASEDADAARPDELEQKLAGRAAVIDQSSAYARLSLTGELAWQLLAKGAFIDLRPKEFTPGAAAVTMIAHMGVILWRRADGHGFEVACFRSHAGSFWHWLLSAAEGEGLTLTR